MKNIVTIKCLSVGGFIPKSNFIVYIYYKNKPIYKGITNKYGKVQIMLCNNLNYTIIIRSQKGIEPSVITQKIYVSDHYFQTFTFYFYENFSLPSIFHLTDKNYVGLPIEKGELILWQNNIISQ